MLERKRERKGDTNTLTKNHIGMTVHMKLKFAEHFGIVRGKLRKGTHVEVSANY